MRIKGGPAQLAALPIAPILLLPLILPLFVILFPLWGLALGVLGLALLVTRGLDRLVPARDGHPRDRVSAPVHRAFRWVLTFGGLADRDAAQHAAPVDAHGHRTG
jgi:hypothetical protein